MKRWLLVSAVLMIAVGVVAQQAGLGQPKDGPGDGGAVLRLPDLNAPAKNAPLPYYLKDMEKPKGTKIAAPPSNNTDINKDIEVTPQAGNFLIMVMSYAGPEAPQRARHFVAVMRQTYRLNAYVFNYGAEEKRKEYERVQKIRQEQIDALKAAKLDADVPIRVSTMKIDEHTGVLVGGYKTFDEATEALKGIRKLNAEHLRGNVDLDVSVITSPQPTGPTRTPGKVEVIEKSLAYVNPFLRAFPCRNPSLPKEQAYATGEQDLNFLRKINKGEPFSLLECKQPFTLAIKQFDTQHKTLDARSGEKAKSFLESFDKGLVRFGWGKDWEDVAAQNAHSLADSLRKAGLKETYVLHCKYCSYVTVGAYGANDPRMLAMQNTLEQEFRRPQYVPLKMMPRPMPMPVPGVGLTPTR